MRPILLSTSALPLLALVLLAVPREGSAQQVPSPYTFIDTRHEVSLVGGVLSENRGQLGLGPGGGPIFGARWGIKLGGAFGVEVNGFFLDTDRDVIDPFPEEGPELLGSASTMIGALEGRIRFSPVGPRTWNRLSPYAVAGGGLAVDFQGRSALEEELSANARFSFGPAFVGTLGGGIRWLPGERTTIRVEGALHLWRLGTPQAYLQLEQELPFGPVPDTDWVGMGALVLGASYRF